MATAVREKEHENPWQKKKPHPEHHWLTKGEWIHCQYTTAPGNQPTARMTCLKHASLTLSCGNLLKDGWKEA